MKRFCNIMCVALASVSMVVAVSCNKEETITMTLNATLEQPRGDNDNDSVGAKNYLTNEEQWIYWESGDEIGVGSSNSGGSNGNGTEPSISTVSSGAGTRFAYFKSQMTTTPGATDYFAIYPRSSYMDEYVKVNNINVPCLKYPASMPYRPNADATDPDHSFGKNSFPMVAWFRPVVVGGQTQADIDFHSVSGLVRFHLYSSSATAAKINSITFTSVEHDGIPARQISGKFIITNINQNAPYLEGTSSAASDKVITMPFTDVPDEARTIGGENKGKYMTFYLPLPAIVSGTTGSTHNNQSAEANQTKYAIEMKVSSDKGTFTRGMTVTIRRNSIMKMQALGIENWASNTNSVGLVGCGTQERPFQIYDVADMQLVRNAYRTAAINNAAPVINGITVTGDTYFKVSRTDIVLNSDNWQPSGTRSAGIENFIGHFICSTNAPTTFGISNTSEYPLFESIGTDGVVEYTTVRGSITYKRSTSTPFSPLCNVNNGTMNNCHNRCAVTSNGARLAGLCVTNNGTITAGANEGTLSTGTSQGAAVAGLCLYNYGTVQGVEVSSATLTSQNVAGICYKNKSNGVVKDCIVTVSGTYGIPTGAYCGMVVFDNEAGATIDNCFVQGQNSTRSSVGGIAFNNMGTINYCRSDLAMTATKAGAGIAVNQFGVAAEIRNCFTRSKAMRIIASDAAAGIVCYLKGGAVRNCYNCASAERGDNSAVAASIVAVLGAYGDTTDAITLANVYNSSDNFFGITANRTVNDVFLNNITQGRTPVTFINCYDYKKDVKIKINNNQYDAIQKVNATGSQTQHEVLLASLRGWTGIGDGKTYYDWEGGATAYPTIKSPINPVSKSYIKRKYQTTELGAAFRDNASTMNQQKPSNTLTTGAADLPWIELHDVR